MENRNIKLWRWLFGGMAAVFVLLATTSGTVVADTMFHLMRVECLAEHLAAGGGYPCRLYTAACNGYGYAVPLFYCDVFLLPFAALRALGVSLSVCHALLVFTLPTLVGVLMWCLSGWFGLIGERRWLCTGIYLFSPSLVMALFNFEQVGGVFAAAFLPCAVFPTLALLTEKAMSRERLVSACRWLCVGLVGTLCSHLISTVVLTLFLLVVGALRLPFLLRHRERLFALGVVGLVALGLTAWLWLPLLEQRSAHLLCFDVGPKSNFAENAIRLPGLFLPWKVCAEVLAPRWGDFWAVPGETFALWGWVLLPALGVLFLCRKRLCAAHTWVRLAGGISIVLLFFFAFRPLLALAEPLFGWMQFPSRFFPLWACLAAPLFALGVAAIHCRWLRMAFGMGLFIAFLMAQTYPLAKRVDTYRSGKKHILTTSYGVGYGEYLPTRWARAREARGGSLYDGFYFHLPPKHAISADGSVTLDVATPQASVSVPRFYYKGYAATLDGAPCPIRENAEGCVEAVVGHRTGKLRVWYAGTPLQRLSTWISLGCLLLLIAYFLRRPTNG